MSTARIPDGTPQGLTCTDQWEPDARPQQTHTCDRPAGHEGMHRCPLCGSHWDLNRYRGGRVIPAPVEYIGAQLLEQIPEPSPAAPGTLL